MMYRLYDLLVGAAYVVVSRVLRLPRFGPHDERRGLYPPGLVSRLRGRKVLWLHSASVGELLATRALLARFRQALPQWAIVLSTTSFAGRELARELPEADGAVLLPVDRRAYVERAIEALSPALFVFTETELWPNLLRALARRSVPALLVSGRVSPRSFRRYRWARPFLRRVLRDVAVFGMQSEAEADRIRALGAPPDRVRVTGSLKLDGAPSPGRLTLDRGGPLWIAASTHAGEEEICARVFAAVRRRFPDLRMILAPRHLDRLAVVDEVLRAEGIDYVRRSTLETGRWVGEPKVLLLDTLGELSGLYSEAAVAFVGGSLARVGGHNLLEPARVGVPVLFGPHVENVTAVAQALEQAGGGVTVRDEGELAAKLEELIGDPEVRLRMGAAARSVLSDGGVVEATFQAAAEFFAGAGA